MFATVVFLIAASSFPLSAQQAAAANAVVPTLVNFSGMLAGGNGEPLTNITGVTFSLYAEQNSAAPLWLETQNVQPNQAGQYSVMLGSTTSQGLPASLFASGQARWLQVQAQGQEPQPRIMLLSVPYALKAGDAATVGGLPPSAFVLAAPAGGSAITTAKGSAAASAAALSPLTSSDVTTTGGTVHRIPLFTTATNIQNSLLSQSGTNTINAHGNLNASGTITGGEVVSSDVVTAATGFVQGPGIIAQGDSNGNSFFGYSGNGFVGEGNTSVGTGALASSTGTDNTALGVLAGQYIGGQANTFLGWDSGGDNTVTLNYATAVGAEAVVGESNAVVLGAISGQGNCGPPTCLSAQVGIGTPAPQYTLHVVDNGSGGIEGFSSFVGNSAVYGQNTATSGIGTNGGTFYTSSPQGAAIVGVNLASDSLAGYFGGNVYISGSLSKGSGSFEIDHPLDPANKYLYHSFVESPDMMNIYDGVVKLDARGSAWITLPAYFEALNRDFRYQLTSVGRPQPSLYIAREISGNRFMIAGGKPGGKVSWQVTGIRQDAYANAHRIPTEVEKPESERGRYLHPELFGASETERIGRLR